MYRSGLLSIWAALMLIALVISVRGCAIERSLDRISDAVNRCAK